MNHLGIDWKDQKRHIATWQKMLCMATEKLLTSSSNFELSSQNEAGYFYRVRNSDGYEQMKTVWKNQGKVPEEWMTRDNYPGMQTAMFDPVNTFASSIMPVMVLRLYFKDGYMIFDRLNKDHKKLSESWKGDGKPNSWDVLKDREYSMKSKIESNFYPSHKKFFEENSFGGIVGYPVVGYHDAFVSPVAVLEDSIERIDFLGNVR
ncbi:MAG: hypothetical protein V1818_01760 [Candidatus Aenigmatarchaeota archaeon]